MKKRFWEIDFLRGIAIIMMIIFHFLWNLNYFYEFNIILSRGFWGIFQIITASLFLFLVGTSLAISNINKNTTYLKYLKRGLKIFSFGLIITLVTIFIFPNSFVIFGILHLIGVSIIISYIFRRFKYLNLVLGIIFIILGNILKKYVIDFNWLLFLGLRSGGFSSVDYFPIFPWFGVILIGIFFGKLLYSINKRNFRLKDLSENLVVRFVCFLGKKSLIIYLLHQVVLYGAFLILASFF